MVARKKTARSLLDGLFEGTTTNRFGSNALSRLPLCVESCKTALGWVRDKAQLNLFAMFEQIVKQLPHSLQSYWVENVDRLTRSRRKTRSVELADFVSSMAIIAQGNFEHLPESNRKNPGLLRPCKRDPLTPWSEQQRKAHDTGQ